MDVLGKILVPIDVNTDNSEQISSAIQLATAYKSGIILMSVIPDLDLKDEIKGIVEKSVTSSLNDIKKTFTENDIEVHETIVAFGNIVETIINKVNSSDINLVLISENIKNKRAKFKLSGKSEQIIRASDVPVYLVCQTKKKFLNHILCPVDFSEPSRRALYNAISLARKFNATLTILNVFEPLDYISSRITVDLEEENTLRLQRAHDDTKDFIGEFDLEEVDHKIEIKSGKAFENILDMIKKQDIDFLIMGTNGRTGLSSYIMGNITEKVIREMPCSFITVKKINAIGVSTVTYA